MRNPRPLMLVFLLFFSVVAFADEPKPPVRTPEEQQLVLEAQQLEAESGRLYRQGKHAAAAEVDRQALATRQKLYPASKYPDGHPNLATSFANLGASLQAAGQAEEALVFAQRSLEMRRNLNPKAKHPHGHELIAMSLYRIGSALQAMGQSERALPYHRECLEMRQRLYPPAQFPDGHRYLAVSLNDLGNVLQSMGQLEQALPVFRQSLEMSRKLYPDGHAQLAVALHNVGFALQRSGQAEKALPYYRQSLEMREQLYPPAKFPDGHAEIAASLNSLALALQLTGQPRQALPLSRQCHEMLCRLIPLAMYPDGHPELANSLNNLSSAMDSVGQVEEALVLCRQSREMNQRIYPTTKYPDGHPALAISLNNLGWQLRSADRAAEALPFIRQSLEMQQRLLRRELARASEESAFDKINAQPRYRDHYLQVTRTLQSSAAESFAVVWPSRSMATRMLEQRLANARAVGTELGVRLDELRRYRRRVDQLLQDRQMEPQARDQMLAAVTAERDKLERELAARIPALKRWRELDELGPDDLAKALPAGAVFIDLIRYERFEMDPTRRGSTAATHTPWYVAFVLAKGQPLRRIEFDEPARGIDVAVASWREAIDRKVASPAAERLREWVWQRLAAAIPSDVRTIYLAPDGDLARLPWAALPIGQGRVLLEQYAVSQTPHGAFLLNQLRSSALGRLGVEKELLLALGGLDYVNRESLPGAAGEVEALTRLAPGAVVRLTKTDATAERFKQLLPCARYAHLATHGEFNADALTKEKERTQRSAEQRLRSDLAPQVAAKNPLGYVGLVLANDEVLSGLGIVDLPLDNLHLVTLSACETGLGEYTGGEGVQGLQRAFHLAGCPNVIASLWKVNDAATAALMVKFYHELWVNKKPPIEALREAQLTIYRRPDLIPVLAAERGIKLEKAIESASVQAAPDGTPRDKTPTRLWAAFVLSGVGK